MEDRMNRRLESTPSADIVPSTTVYRQERIVVHPYFYA